MNLSEKPFACNEKNCNMTFANEDHLNSHQKKHTMSFNIELAVKSNETALVGDQTPTPTSFFRNCEEVGLFQDLQNVNPFEETFKKALENSGNDSPKLGALSVVANEDTLHTPHIFPIAEEVSNKIVVNDNTELSITNFVEIPKISEKVIEQANLRYRLKQAILKKDKLKISENVENISASDLSRITENVIYLRDEISGNNKRDCSISEKSICGQISISSKERKSSLERMREMNRAAQMRCRTKKKRHYDRMATELGILKKENSALKLENTRLRQNSKHLWKMIEQLGGTKGPDMVDKIDVHVIRDTNPNPKVSKEVIHKKLPALAPARNMEGEPGLQQCVIYNLVPVQMLNNSSNSVNELSPSTGSTSKEVKKRKTMPRILKRS